MDYMGKISGRREILGRQIVDFPFMACAEAALDLQENLGYIIVRGEYVGHIDDNYREELRKYLQKNADDTSAHVDYYRSLPDGFTRVSHSLNYDVAGGKFVDITGNQFDKSLDDIIFFDRENPRIALPGASISSHTTHIIFEFMIGSMRDLRVIEELLADKQ